MAELLKRSQEPMLAQDGAIWEFECARWKMCRSYRIAKGRVGQKGEWRLPTPFEESLRRFRHHQTRPGRIQPPRLRRSVVHQNGHTSPMTPTETNPQRLAGHDCSGTPEFAPKVLQR